MLNIYCTAILLIMLWKSKLMTKDSLGLMQQYMLSSVTKLSRFFLNARGNVFHTKKATLWKETTDP